jgi:hypothetical protein
MKREANPIIRFQDNPTRKNAIHAKCAECFGCTPKHLEPSFRQSISACTTKACPLYYFRPYRANSMGVTAKRGQ